ncbi:hypothetical protein CUB78_06680 [Prochlorococcus marinus str. XMU1401]|uniref:Inositol monophosphatase n=1 Tax=Prochlorococcus marinus str. XMU1401 TaxID=2052594 RepID=A0A8I1X3R9_PROMR|nr:inositol monophosphatase [Prochlorococcus marinus]MBO8223288.1 inositol monophosphatase [Prochlorococcus marinus str. XMU1401]MBW3059820.1 hypothetical protein [Prochlorococcus marinus str. XMU1401E]MCQ9198954.1 inositol monophosphatase [Prochlorococcus marinus XMU1429]PJC83634.1 hypothetical protein CUB78_06680 [Prochlorococcus marinus str. XMU1401]
MKLSPQTINAINAGLKAGKLLYQYRNENLNIKLKGNSFRDVVTEIDIASENIILDELGKNSDSFTYISEEKGDQRKNTSSFWIIDPLDGTANYSSGLPIYGVSIAYVENFKLKSSVIYLPETNDLYFAEINKGAFKNNKKLNANIATQIEDSLIGITFPSMFNENTKKESAYKIYSELNFESKGVLRLGSSVYCLALLAENKLNSIVGFKAKIWDIAAGILICKEAGLKTDFLEASLKNENHDYIIANAKLYEYLKNIIIF